MKQQAQKDGVPTKKPQYFTRKFYLLKSFYLVLLFSLLIQNVQGQSSAIALNDDEYFESTGVNILAFSNW